MEDTLEKKQRMNLLMDLYEDLLTEKQREYLDLYYHEDLSLSEISLIKNVSKNAVFDNIKKACLHLENYEEKLQLLEKHKKRLEIIDDLEKDKLAQERDISVLKDKEKYQTDQQKKETAQILSSAETSVKNLENEIAEHKATIEEYNQRIKKSKEELSSYQK